MERTRYHIIKNRQELDTLIESCKRTGYACIDYETNAKGLYYKDFKPTILSVSFMPGFGCSIPLDHPETKKYCGSNWNWKKELKHFGREVIENPKITKVAWNAKFDDQINQKYGIYYRGTMLDGMLAKYVLNEERPHGLKDMVRLYLPESANYESDKGFDKLPWDKKPLKRLCEYGCQDTDYTLRLMIFLEKKLIDLGFYSVFRNLFMCNSRVLTSVEKEGLYVDVEFNKKLIEEYKPKIDNAHNTIMELPVVKRFQSYYTKQRISAYLESIEKELEELDYNDPKDARKIASREQKISNVRAGVYSNKTERELVRPINLNSKKDLPELMFSKKGFKMTPLKETNSGSPSTDEESLIKLRLEYKDPKCDKAIFLDNLLELRGLEKMYKTYIVGWNEKIQDDSRLHGRYNITGTDSNRFSSADPNMQQIPKTSVDPNIKKQLIAPPGYLYMAFDYSQAELRMMAHLSGDETYLKAFRDGVDPHLSIAAKKYGVPIEEASKAYDDENHPDHKLWKVRRKGAKQIAFGLIYGIGSALLAVKLSDPKAGIIVSKEEAQKEMDEFFADHPKIKKFKAKQEKFVKKYGYYTQLFGTRRRLPQIYSDNNADVAYAIRLGLNFPCLLPSSQALCKTKGWVNYDKLSVGDYILAFNPETNKSEWQQVTNLHVLDYDGDMYTFNSKHCGIQSTNYHRWYTTNKRLDRFKVSTSEEIFEKSKTSNVRIPIVSEHNFDRITDVYEDWFIALCGWYLTDASLKGGKYVRIVQSINANPNKVDHIEKLLSSSTLHYNRSISCNGLVSWVLSIEDSKLFTDILPGRRLNMKFISSLNKDHLDILLYNMRLGDGWSIFASGDEEQAQLVQAIVTLLGKTSSMFILSKPGDRSYFKDRKPSKLGQEYVESKKFSYGIKFSDRKTVHTNSYGKCLVDKIPYKGKVWCPTVKTGAFFTRYQGTTDGRYRTMITGNCQGAAANMTNFGAILLYWKMRQGKLPMMKEACTVHDAVYMYTKPENINTWTVHSIWEILRNPSTKKYFGFQVDDVAMSMDFTIGRSMAEELPFIPGYDYNKMLEPDFDVEEYMKEYHTLKSKKVGNFTAASPEVFGKLYKKEMKAYEENFKKSRK